MGRRGGGARMQALSPAELTRLGQEGGKALTPEECRAIASKAGGVGAAARWVKERRTDSAL